MAALAICGGVELNTFPFMQLAAEIRLDIYGHLLIASPCCFKVAKDSNGSSKGVVLELTYKRTYKRAYRFLARDQKQAIAFKRTSNGMCASIGLTPQILCTCKAVHREATSILYKENIFHFQLNQISLMPGLSEQYNFKASCQELYRNPVECWDDGSRSALNASSFAIFLRQIGQQNAASCRKLRFVAQNVHTDLDAHIIGSSIQLVTQLLECHVPGVRQVKISYNGDHWDRFESAHLETFGKGSEILEGQGNNNSHTNKSTHEDSPLPTFWDSDEESQDELTNPLLDVGGKEQVAMYRATFHMVQMIPWLKHLSVVGFDKDLPAYQKMKNLETLVRTRRCNTKPDSTDKSERGCND